MQSQFDVIIVGAGPAGSSLAARLARAGRKTALLDASDFPRQKVCGEYLTRAACAALPDAESVATLRQRGVAVTRMRLQTPTARTIELPLAAETESQSFAVSRFLFDEMLVQQAVHAGARFYPRHRVRDIVRSSGAIGGVVASSAHAVGTSLTYRAPLVIAADGRRSTLVKQTGNVSYGKQRACVGFKSHVSWFAADGAMASHVVTLHSLPGGYVGVNQIEDGSWNVCGMMPRHVVQRARGKIDDALAAWVSPHAPLAGFLKQVQLRGPWLAIPEVRQQRAVPRTPGVLYVGDACGTVEPLTGQGMTMALQMAKCLSDRILADDLVTVDRVVQRELTALWWAMFGRRVRAASLLGAILRRPRLLDVLVSMQQLSPALATGTLAAAYRLTTAGGPSPTVAAYTAP